MRPLIGHASACLVVLGVACGGRATSLVEERDSETGSPSAPTGDAKAGQVIGAGAGDALPAPFDAAWTDAESGDAWSISSDAASRMPKRPTGPRRHTLAKVRKTARLRCLGLKSIVASTTLALRDRPPSRCRAPTPMRRSFKRQTTTNPARPTRTA